MLSSTNTAPIPTGPKQYATALTLSYALQSAGAVENFFGSLQLFVANSDGTNPMPLGAQVPLAPAADSATVQLKAAVLAAVQAYITAKGL